MIGNKGRDYDRVDGSSEKCMKNDREGTVKVV